MQVHELIAILEEQEPDAEVVIVTQRNWPLELALHGVALREDILIAHKRDAEAGEGSPVRGDGGQPSDVLLVSGEHLRYGDDAAWNVAAA